MLPSKPLSGKALVDKMMCTFCLFCYRNQSYHTRVQLAVLNHNFHANRDQAQNKSGENLYSRKFREQTKKWDITPIRTNKS